MHIKIQYASGKTETVAAWIEADTISSQGSWRPGIRTADPSFCYFLRDYFDAAINEGDIRKGSESPEPGIDITMFEAFEWELVGNELAESKALIGIWAARLGRFDPTSTAEEHDRLSDEERVRFELDRKCWLHYLPDPAATLEETLLELEAVAAPRMR